MIYHSGMINQGFNLSDYQRNQLLAQQAVLQNQMIQQQFAPRSMRKNMYSVIEVQNADEIRNFKLEAGITYIFLNENSDRIYLRQINEKNEIVSYAYVFTQTNDDELADPVEKLENRMNRIEQLLGEIANVQSQNSNGRTEKASAKAGSEFRDVENQPMENAKPEGVQRGVGSRQRKD